MDSKGWKRVLTKAAVVASVLGMLSALAVRQRALRVQQIRNELRQLEVGMSMQDVRDSLTITPSGNDPDRASRPGEMVVVWRFSTVPRN